MKDSKNKYQTGMGALVVTIVLLVLIVIGTAGFIIFNRHNDKTPTKSSHMDPPKASPASSNSDNKPTNETKSKHYSNDKYGINFDYPEEWNIEEVKVNSSQGPVPIEFNISLSANTTEKYKETAVVEIYNKSYPEVTNYYNSAPLDDAMARGTKTQGTILGKTATHYVYDSDSSKAENFIFAVSDKTYGFRSINEELNKQRDPGYWDKFTRVRDSLRIK